MDLLAGVKVEEGPIVILQCSLELLMNAEMVLLG